MAKSKWYNFEGELFFPQVFEQNRDMGGDDNDAARAVKAKGGIYTTVFIPKDEEVLKDMLEKGYPEVSMGHPQVKVFAFAGDRKGMKLKRGHIHPTIEDFGGAPDVFNWTDSICPDKWDMDVDGVLGNGTKAVVTISIFKMNEDSTPTVRLERIGITDHVPYEVSEYAAAGW